MSPTERPLRIVLAEDSPLLRAGVESVLASAGHVVCAGVADAQGLLHAWEAHRPDLVVTDVRMPPTNTDDGLRAAAALRQRDADLPIVVLSQYVSVAYLDELLGDDTARGGVGYLLKERVGHVRQFLDAVDRVARGETIVDPDVVRALVKATRSRAPLAVLTDREREVLSLVAEGHTNSLIAQRLTVSEAAVRKHVGSIFSKLPLQDGDRRVQATLIYLRSLG
ncbi:LuxR family two component transcriptional regulator [Rhodococcus sp. OK611]|uniref:response regulator n=1 Tax=unclassified Rhodococcus (in: high G+C Gram-positive bacteria) TaxID=192944 RepID=UPI000BC9E490|nr:MULTISPECIES: response regulator transcription factor [unclassified Rhodococcus (in: high G+C Gram-positive bacteria)]PTR43186.1 LuxR family two component transcriptional regulator [Rhodococcus sp. OK611]SNX91050.1 two component transcriptional regulator, LuxR family [Rhodococcus sp. OK270]